MLAIKKAAGMNLQPLKSNRCENVLVIFSQTVVFWGFLVTWFYCCCSALRAFNRVCFFHINHLA